MATPYTPIELWANAVANNGYVHEKGDIKSGLLTGVKSCWQQQVVFFDGENYRDDGPLTTMAPDSSGTYNQLTLVADPATPVADTFALTGTAAPTNVTTSNPDDVLHIPPRAEEKKRTMLQFWDHSAGAGSGNLLYQCWADRFLSWEVSTTAPTYI